MRQKVIIDCDPGIDDSLALMLALSMEELEVAGITIVCGNCPVEMGAANARKVLGWMNRTDIPVFAGAEKPLKRRYIDALDTHGRDGLGESFLPEAKGMEQDMTAAQFLEKTLKKEPCSVIALGPLTNLALLAQNAPEAFGQIRELVSMGGNYRSTGNCSPVAEYNYWADPDGAACVYEAMELLGKQVVMAGLDVTRQIVLTPDLLEYLKRLDPRTGNFVQAITRFYFDFHWKQEHLIGCVINDPLAVAYFADRSLCQGVEAYTQVETEGICLGQTVVDTMSYGKKGAVSRNGQPETVCEGTDFYGKRPNSLVLTKTDPLRFFQLFFDRLLNMDREDLDLLPVLVRNGVLSE